MGNAIRGSATIDGKAWAPVTVAAEYQDGPNGLLLLSAVLYWISSRHCGKQKGAGGGGCDGQIELQDTALGIVCVRRLLALMNSHPSYKYIFEICIWLPMRMRVRIWMCEWATVSGSANANGRPEIQFVAANAMQTSEMSADCEMMPLTMNNSSHSHCEQAHLMLCAHVAYAQYLNSFVM